MRVISCRSAYGKGGLGQHFAQLVEESRAANRLKAYYAHTALAGDEDIARLIGYVKLKRTKRYTPLRFAPKLSGWLGESIFDRKVAGALTDRAEAFMGFVGKSLHSFKKARKLGYQRLELVAANSHVSNVQRKHRKAKKLLNIDDTWLGEGLLRKTLREYEMADLIYTHSEYTRQSLIEEGIDEQKLRSTHLVAADRFVPPRAKPDDGVFRIVYIGRIEATKGVPVLIEAFSRFSNRDAELTLVGGWSSGVMKRRVHTWIRRDGRIRIAPGDPLPALHRADVYVHPTFEDGFAYSPVEALACGVPVIVTEDTGMKERVVEGENGFIVPTGSWEGILDRLEHVSRHPLAGTSALSNLTNAV